MTLSERFITGNTTFEAHRGISCIRIRFDVSNQGYDGITCINILGDRKGGRWECDQGCIISYDGVISHIIRFCDGDKRKVLFLLDKWSHQPEYVDEDDVPMCRYCGHTERDSI